MRRSSRKSNPAREVFRFWMFVGLLSLLLAGVGFAAGKYLVGGMAKSSSMDQGAPEIVVQDPDAAKEDATALTGPPPPEAVVKLEERAPTAAERVELELQQPQDGAQLHEDTGDAISPDSSLGPDDKPLKPAAKDDEKSSTPAKSDEKTKNTKKGAYTVVAGSFADPTNAEAELSRLSAQGYQPYVVKVKREGKTFHRVCVGAFGKQSEAARLRDKLIEDGTPASLSRD